MAAREAPPPSPVDRVNAFMRKRSPRWLYLAGALFPLWLLAMAVTGGLGVEPVEVLEHQLGERGLQVLIATLCVTPLRRYAGVNLLRFRRALGQIGFAYILLHLLVWLFLDVQIWSQIWADIVKRPYITIGMAGFLLLVPLAATSNDWSLRRMGAANWRRLHKLAYLATTLGALHWVMLAKGWQWEPVLYLAGVSVILTMRLKPRHAAVVLAR